MDMDEKGVFFTYDNFEQIVWSEKIRTYFISLCLICVILLSFVIKPRDWKLNLIAAIASLPLILLLNKILVVGFLQ